MLRSVYLALCEIESDFADKPITFFTKTVGTYAGLSREAAGKYINLLVKEGLIRKTQVKDPQTKKFSGGTVVEIIDFANRTSQEAPLSGYPSSGVSQQRGIPTGIKNISMDKKISIATNVNGNLQTQERRNGEGMVALGDLVKQVAPKPHGPPKEGRRRDSFEEKGKREYVARTIAEALGDQKSLGAYRVLAAKVPDTVLFECVAKVKETWREGKVRQSRGALFMSMVQQYCTTHNITLGFGTSRSTETLGSGG